MVAFKPTLAMAPKGNAGRDMLHMPLRYASIGNKISWTPLQDLISFTRKASTPSVNLEMLLPMFEQAFHTATRDYQKTSQTIGYKQLTDQLLNLGLEEVNGRLYRQYRVLISDISEPAVWTVTVHDIADFLMAWHSGSLEEAGAVFDISLPIIQEEAPPDQEGRGAFQNRLKTMLAEGKIDKVLDALSEAGDNDFQNSVILLSGRYKRMQRDERRGLMTNSQTGIETARINQALLSLIDDLE